jgi:hypothetical protein
MKITERIVGLLSEDTDCKTFEADLVNNIINLDFEGESYKIIIEKIGE